jgi:hypothetical protein
VVDAYFSFLVGFLKQEEKLIDIAESNKAKEGIDLDRREGVDDRNHISRESCLIYLGNSFVILYPQVFRQVGLDCLYFVGSEDVLLVEFAH